MNSRGTIERADVVADAGVGAALGYSRPGSYEELRAVLSSGTARLPKKLRQVAIHLWQHPTAVALGTVTSVAREAGVQPSTLVRFAQAFGYSGFSDLQEVFKVDLAGGGRSRDRWESGSSSEAARLVDGFIGSCKAALAGVRDRLDRLRASALRGDLRCGPRDQLYALQLHHPGIGCVRRTARRSHRVADR